MQIIMQEFLSVDDVVFNPVQQYLGHMSTIGVWLWWDVHSGALIKFRKKSSGGVQTQNPGFWSWEHRTSQDMTGANKHTRFLEPLVLAPPPCPPVPSLLLLAVHGKNLGECSGKLYTHYI